MEELEEQVLDFCIEEHMAEEFVQLSDCIFNSKLFDCGKPVPYLFAVQTTEYLNFYTDLHL